jgi:hypothetical protein
MQATFSEEEAERDERLDYEDYARQADAEKLLKEREARDEEFDAKVRSVCCARRRTNNAALAACADTSVERDARERVGHGLDSRRADSLRAREASMAREQRMLRGWGRRSAV